MRTAIRRLGLTTLMLACTVGWRAASVHGAVRPAPARFAALDGGGPVVPHVRVTAMTQAPSGALYAAGVYVVPNNDRDSVNKMTTLGSTWLVSYGHGAPGTWNQRISTTNPKAFPKTGVAPWIDHTALPIDFTTMGIAIDPHNQSTIYLAGCVDIDATCSAPTPGASEHLVVRSVDSGRTWQDLLTTGTPIRGVGSRPPGTVLPTAGYSVLVDPDNSRRLYVALNNIGTLRSEDAGRTWIYVRQPQSNFVFKPCELLAGLPGSHMIYELAREGTLYRTTDAGMHWQVRPQTGLPATHLASLTWVGRMLYVTANRGIYVSADGGAHWHLFAPTPLPGGFDQSVRDSNGWISDFDPQRNGPVAGLYAMRDGQRWQPVADTTSRGPKPYGALDFDAISATLDTRLWEDSAARVVFTGGALGGLYRWQSRL